MIISPAHSTQYSRGVVVPLCAAAACPELFQCPVSDKQRRNRNDPVGAPFRARRHSYPPKVPQQTAPRRPNESTAFANGASRPASRPWGAIDAVKDPQRPLAVGPAAALAMAHSFGRHFSGGRHNCGRASGRPSTDSGQQRSHSRRRRHQMCPPQSPPPHGIPSATPVQSRPAGEHQLAAPSD